MVAAALDFQTVGIVFVLALTEREPVTENGDRTVKELLGTVNVRIARSDPINVFVSSITNSS